MAHAVDHFVHPVDASQQRGLTTAGGSNECGDLPFVNMKIDYFQSLFFTVIKTEVFDPHNRFAIAGPVGVGSLLPIIHMLDLH